MSRASGLSQQAHHGPLHSRAIKLNNKRKLHLPCGVHVCFMIVVFIVGPIPWLASRSINHHSNVNLTQQKAPLLLGDTNSNKNIKIGNATQEFMINNDEQKENTLQIENRNNQHQTDDQDNSVTFHFIVSSECSSYQLWETITTFHSAESVRQCGRFTWIISGCLPNDKLSDGIGKSGAKSDLLTPHVIQQHIDVHFPPPSSASLSDCSRLRPELHFTPDYSDMSVYGGPYADGRTTRYYNNPKTGKQVRSSYGNRYVFNNKPNGLLHWATEHAEEHAQVPDEAVVLIDPDFLFLTHFHLVRPDLTVIGKQRNNNDKILQKDRDLVFPGQPAAASYGLGSQWLDFDRATICGPDSHCTNTTHHEVHKHYSAGPPYVIHRADVLALATKWAALVPPTYDEYPLLYAEMYAYSMAAAHLQLQHNLINGLFTGCMVGWPNPKRWAPQTDLEAAEKTAVQKSAQVYRSQLETELAALGANNNEGAILHPQPNDKQEEIGGASSCFLDLTPPSMLHYCNRYFIEATDAMKQIPGQERVTYRFFAKRSVSHSTVLACDNSSTRFVPFASYKYPEKMAEGNADWNTLTVCAITRALNFARDSGCHNTGRAIQSVAGG